MEKRVQLVDCDPQANSTSGIGIDQEDLHHDLYSTFYTPENIHESISSTRTPFLDVLPASTNLVAVELEPDAQLPEPIEVRKVLFDREEQYIDTKVYQRGELKAGTTVEGPAILEQMDSTTVIPPNWNAYTDAHYNLIATYQGGGEE